jgi:hypothetical protein
MRHQCSCDWRSILSCLAGVLTAIFVVGHAVGLQLLRAADQPVHHEVTTSEIENFYLQLFGDNAQVRCPASTRVEHCVQVPPMCKKFPTTRPKDARYARSGQRQIAEDWFLRGLCWPGQQKLWMPGDVQGVARGRQLLADTRCEPYDEYKAVFKPPRWLEHAKSSIPTYYINLHTNRIRDAKMSAVLDKIVAQYTRIEAVDASVPGFAQNHSHFADKMGAHGIPEYQTIAMLLSHRRAIQAAFDKGDKRAFIAEDGLSLELSSFWGEALDSFADALPPGWMAVQLGYSRYTTAPTALITAPAPLYYRSMYQRAQQGAEAGAFAYLITREGMASVLSQPLNVLKQRCPPFVADECLLGFARRQPFRDQGPMADRVFLATPPFFTVDLEAATSRFVGNAAKNEARAGFCASLHANAVTDRYTCANQTSQPAGRAAHRRHYAAEASAWLHDGCTAEYYLGIHLDELTPILGSVPLLPLTEIVTRQLERHYMRRGKGEGKRCSPCPQGQRLEKAPLAWWMAEGSMALLTQGLQQTVPERGGPIAIWPATPTWPKPSPIG